MATLAFSELKTTQTLDVLISLKNKQIWVGAQQH